MFEDSTGDLKFRLRDYEETFGNRKTGEQIRNLISNLIKQNPRSRVRVSMDDVSVVSSSFADEAFGKLVAEVGFVDFSSRIQFENINPLCKSIIDSAVEKRLAQRKKVVEDLT